MTALMIALGALVGAPARYLTDHWVQSRHLTRFPWGTLTVNLVACLVLGALVAGSQHIAPDLAALLGPGLCATLSTYSTFSYETVRLVESREWRTVCSYPLLSVVAGVGAAAVGWSIGAAF